MWCASCWGRHVCRTSRTCRTCRTMGVPPRITIAASNQNSKTTHGVSRHRLNPTGKSYLLPRIIAYTAYCGLFGLLPRLAAQARKPTLPSSPNAHGTANHPWGMPPPLNPTGKSYLRPRIIAYTAYSGLFGLLPRLADQARKPNQPSSPNAHGTANRSSSTRGGASSGLFCFFVFVFCFFRSHESFLDQAFQGGYLSPE